MNHNEQLILARVASCCVAGFALLVAPLAARQAPDPTVWWGGFSPPRSPVPDDRFEINAEASGSVLVSAPLGKTSVSWGLISVKPDSSIEFRAAGQSPWLCKLQRQDSRTYKGTCQGSGDTRDFVLTRDQPPHGLDLPLSDTDFRILARARQILATPSVWNRHDDRACDHTAGSWSLFCALYQASVDVTGRYAHLGPVMMQIRAVVGEATDGKMFQHQLMDYNNLASTAHADIVNIFDRTERRLEATKACEAARPSNWSLDSQGDQPAASTEVPLPKNVNYWVENISYTAQQKGFSLSDTLGQLNANRQAPPDWLAQSTMTARRTWMAGDYRGIDATGMLSNGNQWRLVSQCGVVLSYHDVPAEAASFFDRVISGAFRLR